MRLIRRGRVMHLHSLHAISNAMLAKQRFLEQEKVVELTPVGLNN